jgi:hypothetical protein
MRSKDSSNETEQSDVESAKVSDGGGESGPNAARVVDATATEMAEEAVFPDACDVLDGHVESLTNLANEGRKR